MKTLLALLMLTAAAQAQTITAGPSNSLGWTGSLCYANGRSWPARNGICLMEDADSVLTVCMTPECGRLSGTRLIPRDGEPLISAAPRPHCEEGWSLVDAGRPMCARELRDPKAQ